MTTKLLFEFPNINCMCQILFSILVFDVLPDNGPVKVSVFLSDRASLLGSDRKSHANRSLTSGIIIYTGHAGINRKSLVVRK